MALNVWYLLFFLTALVAWYAQAKVRGIYTRYRSIPNARRVSGLEVATQLLAYEGLTSVKIEGIPGELTDLYDPESRTLRLTENEAHDRSITSLGIVAHEVGHAVQDAQGYTAFRLRSTIGLRLSQVAWISPVFLVGGIWLGIPWLTVLGALFIAAQTIFTLVTLPVELNASARAVAMLTAAGLATADERHLVGRVLRAAGLTYLVTFVRQLAYFLAFVFVFLIARGLWQS